MNEWDREIATLLDSVIDGSCTEAELRRFESLLHDPWIRSAYIEQMRIHSLLQWRSGQNLAGTELRDSSRSSEHHVQQGMPFGRRVLCVAVLLTLMLIGVGLGTTISLMRPLRSDGTVAIVTETKGIVWGADQHPIKVAERIGQQTIRLARGTLRLAFDSGAVVTLEGPAELRVISSMRIRAERGRITARATGRAKGFSIETPRTLVVDQGTEFGVEIEESGRTGVVVFEGLVDLSSPNAQDGSATTTRRLEQGEAMRVGESGLLSRIVNVKRRHGETSWSTEANVDRGAVIRSVRDNIRGLASSKYYQIVPRGFQEDALAYVDRNHEWNGVTTEGMPDFLLGADYVKPFNDDKWMKGLQVTVELAQPATLYLLFDNREKAPAWLSAQFTDTGLDIGMDEASRHGDPAYSAAYGPGQSINTQFSIWKREVNRNETVALGALQNERFTNMYGIVAQPRP